MTKKQKGFTLIELLIVVAIIGILAAIAIPNLLTAMQRSKQKRTMADIRSAATAWEAYATDMNKYNAAGTLSGSLGLAKVSVTGTVASKLTPTYIKSLPIKDGWANNMAYESEFDFGSTSPSNVYVIRSPGKENIFTAVPASDGGATTNFNDDIIYSNGSFVRYPEGIQQQ